MRHIEKVAGVKNVAVWKGKETAMLMFAAFMFVLVSFAVMIGGVTNGRWALTGMFSVAFVDAASVLFDLPISLGIIPWNLFF